MTRYAIGYLRLSDADDGSPDAANREGQERTVRELARRDGNEAGLIILDEDWGRSADEAKIAKRTGYQAMLSAIKAGEIAAVYASAADRLYRSQATFVELYRAAEEAGTRIVTAREGVICGDGGPMAKAWAGVTAVFAEYELAAIKARIKGARARRTERYHAAGLPVPPFFAAYGTRHVTDPATGLTRVEPDPVQQHVVINAYEKARTWRGTAVLLNEQGIPSPRGGEWGVTSIRNVLGRLADQGLVTLPERNRGQRHASGRTAVFTSLLVCHCGGRMTPSVARRSYYCGRAWRSESHGRVTVPESRLIAALRPEAEAYLRTIKLDERQRRADNLAAEKNIERRQAALDAKLDVGRLDPDAYRQQTRKLLDEMADLRRDAGIEKRLFVEPIPKWPERDEDAEAMNRHLRRLWSRVQLDDDMQPTAVWRDQRWRYDPEQQARDEAELEQAVGSSSLVILDDVRQARSS